MYDPVFKQQTLRHLVRTLAHLNNLHQHFTSWCRNTFKYWQKFEKTA